MLRPVRGVVPHRWVWAGMLCALLGQAKPLRWCLHLELPANLGHHAHNIASYL